MIAPGGSHPAPAAVDYVDSRASVGFVQQFVRTWATRQPADEERYAQRVLAFVDPAEESQSSFASLSEPVSAPVDLVGEPTVVSVKRDPLDPTLGTARVAFTTTPGGTRYVYVTFRTEVSPTSVARSILAPPSPAPGPRLPSRPAGTALALMPQADPRYAQLLDARSGVLVRALPLWFSGRSSEMAVYLTAGASLETPVTFGEVIGISPTLHVVGTPTPDSYRVRAYLVVRLPRSRAVEDQAVEVVVTQEADPAAAPQISAITSPTTYGGVVS